MKKTACFIVIFFIMLTCTARASYMSEDVYNSMEKAFSWVSDNASPLGHTDSVSSDFFVMAMARANRKFDYKSYVNITNAKKPETIQDAHRIIMANSASGGKLERSFIADNTYNAELNNTSDLATAITAFCGGGYQIKKYEPQVNYMVSRLLKSQYENGSFDNDVLTTAKSITALSFHSGKRYALMGKNKGETYYYDVNSAILRAVDYLQKSKEENCGFGTVQNTSYVLMALDAAGVDGGNDPGFSRDGNSTLGWIIARQLANGSFGDDEDDTAAALCALVSHIRAMQGKAPFFDLLSDDSPENPAVFDGELNLSGKGLTEASSDETIEVPYEMPTATEFVRDENVPVTDDNTDYKNVSALPIIIFITSLILIATVVLTFIKYKK